MGGTGADCVTERAPSPKRRKVRKGTQSCWECKRRKVRCTFIMPTESTCDGCRSRRVKCISQEFSSEAESASSRTNRLDRVEAMVEQLAKQGSTNLSPFPPHDMQNAQTKTMAGRSLGDDAPLASAPSAIPTPGTPIPPSSDIQTKGMYDELRGALLAVWPNQSELDLILNLPVSSSVLFHGIVCMPYSSFRGNDMPSTRDILQLPPPTSHPVFIARNLLMLCSFLQSVPRVATKNSSGLDPRHHEIMSQVYEAANRLVTCNDDLVCSLEGIECIMIESMYQNNAGNLRQAWLTNRRAMSIAQMMGLHLGNSQPTNLLDVKTRGRIDPEYMWLRLVSTDRYLSLVLGLPQGSQESPFATPENLKRRAPMERMERIEAMVGGLIIQRNREDLGNFGTTREIDKLLQDAAATMPAQWWLIPDFATIAGSDPNAFPETLRIINQFTHFHLLAQLHLPYLLKSSADRKYDYSKTTAVNASREILLRFVRFTATGTVAAYCRGIDFLAFIASTTLCLAHIDARRQYGGDMSDGAGASLVHQRLGDCGLMERTLQKMEEMAQVDNDPIACGIASILQRLLAVEAAVANGGCYHTRLCSGFSAQEYQAADNETGSNDTLRIEIPHLGSILFERGDIVKYPEVAQKPFGESVGSYSSPKPSYSGTRLCSESGPPLDRAKHQAGSEVTPPTEPPAVYVDEQGPPSNLDFFDSNDYLTPGQAADVDDWALQGVDMALFDSLFVTNQ